MDSIEFIRNVISNNREEFMHYFDEHMALYNALCFLMDTHSNITIFVKDTEPLVFSIQGENFTDSDIQDIKNKLSDHRISLYDRMFNFNILDTSDDIIDIQVTSIDRV